MHSDPDDWTRRNPTPVRTRTEAAEALTRARVAAAFRAVEWQGRYASGRAIRALDPVAPRADVYRIVKGLLEAGELARTVPRPRGVGAAGRSGRAAVKPDGHAGRIARHAARVAADLERLGPDPRDSTRNRAAARASGLSEKSGTESPPGR